MRANLDRVLAYLGLVGSVFAEVAVFGKRIMSFIDELD